MPISKFRSFIPILHRVAIQCIASAFLPPSLGFKSYLDEANVGGLLPEALTADVEAVLADQTGLVGADSARKRRIS